MPSYPVLQSVNHINEIISRPLYRLFAWVIFKHLILHRKRKTEH